MPGDADSARRSSSSAPGAAAAVSPPALSLPKGGGAIRGIGEKFAANPVTGTGSMSVPLAVSPGRSGFGPQLSLSYDSGSGNGPFGFGWTLSLPAISRKTDKGLPRYQDAEESDVYLLSGAEDLVPVLNENGSRFKDATSEPDFIIHRYRPRIEGLFARIERWIHKKSGEIRWRSIARDNVTTWYGKTGESRIFDPKDPTRVFTWLICESYDDKGNAIIYKYEEEDDKNVDRSQVNERNRVRAANRHLKRILYGNRTSRLVQPDLPLTDWMFEVVFDYDEGHVEELDLDPSRPAAEQHRFVRGSSSAARSWAVRPDPFSSHRGGFEVRTYRRCRRVLMFHRFAELGSEPCLVRATELEYADLDYSKNVSIEAELAHRGSTRFASLLSAVTQSGFVRDETRPATYLRKSLPPLEFEYSKAEIQDDLREIDAADLENLPVGLDGSTYQWVDLDGEGISGILTEQAEAWFYKPNLGEGRFGPVETIDPKPSLTGLGGRLQLLDLDGDGQLDVVALACPAPGFHERTPERNWEAFRSFDHLPNIRWDEPNLRFVDLDGDGHADVLITEDQVFTWYPSLAEEGFGPGRKVRQPLDEEKGPRLLLADGTQSIYLADMCGDGLTDLVRIRNGEVCYWPNLGYGRFGAKVTMDDAPTFDRPDQFSQQRVRLADIDGSGVIDILYLGRDGVRIYFNQSGNRWSGPRRLRQFPLSDNIVSVMTADLLGNGTACLVWSSPLPLDARRPLRYIDLMGGRKPHLLIQLINNLGAETRLQYAPSTKFYLADKRAGKPWITRIPFPVHVVERIETWDRISGNRFVTRYSYHHGYFDGVEREFRGFARVDQWDTEELAAVEDGTNVDPESHVPPVLTRAWFHTGVYLGRDHISNFHAGEYYREPGLTEAQARSLLLDDTWLPGGWSIEEEREACRALKGSMLRQEVYALDGTAEEEHPYTVTEQSFTIRRLQPKGGNRHGVFLTHARESILYHYERIPDDPRVAHELTLDVDEYGNILKSAAVGYGRRKADSSLPSNADRDKQGERLITYTENGFTKPVLEHNAWRAPLPCESRSYELTGYTPTCAAGRFQASDLVQAGLGGRLKHIFDSELKYEEKPGSGKQRRPIEHTRTYYRPDDLGDSLSDPLALLPLGKIESLGLTGEVYKLAFTPGLLAGAYDGRATTTMLADEGRYVHSESDANWWIPSGRLFYSPGKGDTPAQELAFARQHFFLPRRYRDPFHTTLVSTETIVSYDAYDLLVQETLDPLDNRVTAGERDVDPNQPLVKSGQDYRVLQPALLMDPNRNRTAVAFDALGMVVGTAVMGKPEDSPVPGDRLTATFSADLTQAQIDQFFTNPKGAIAATLLDDATTRLLYDLTRYWREPDPLKKPPVYAATLARETHASEPVPAGGLRIQVSFSYSDGFGREIQKKIQAEPGPAPKRDPVTGRILVVDGRPEMTTTDVSPRWVGSGWTVFNNKGKPVRKYEPFFTDTHRFEFDVRIGVSLVLFYDPAGRVIATLHPNHTWEKVVFDAWKQATWDVNDTVLADPKADPDVGDSFRRLPDASYLPTWHARRKDGGLGVHEQEAARKAAIHAATPTLVHFDSLGRTFLTTAHNKTKRSDTPPADPPSEERYHTRAVLDIEGNQREVLDAENRVVRRYDYDMLGNRIHQASMEAGERWMLNDVSGKPIRAWDSRDHRFRNSYDALRRVVGSHLSEGAGPELLVEKTVYGETRLNPEAANLRGKAVQHFDQAGVATSDLYDFKGNLLRSQRQLAQDYKNTLAWSAAVPLEAAIYTSRTRYDALNRPVEVTAPDNSVIRSAFNEANLLERVEANLRGAAATTPFVTEIDYDAKGQRTRIDLATRDGKRISTAYDYDPDTFRLAHLKTRRNASGFDATDRPGEVQNLHYVYDPVGNITHIQDDAQQTVYFKNRQVEPSVDYTYDAVYRLIEATGREHLGQTGGPSAPPDPPTPPDAFNGFHTGLDHPGNGKAMGTYIERYVYDAVGDILSMQHRGSNPSHAGWTRSYTYNETSQLENTRKNNRLSSTTVGATTEVYRYESNAGLHGNITFMPHLPLMQWDEDDQLQATSQQVNTSGGIPEITWYVYDAEGQRIRKVTDSAVTAGEVAAGKKPVRMKERIYLGAFEIHRRYASDGTTVDLERETLHLMDGKRRLAVVETRTQGDDGSPAQLIRYDFGNQLGSASLELDDQARIISYEEYYPYGSTAYQAVDKSIRAASKRYRFTGKERDEESGLYYCGARYYAAIPCRWTSCDPAGLVDGTNLYTYGRNNPVRFEDPTGKQAVQGDSYLAYKDTPDYRIFEAKVGGLKDPSPPPMTAKEKLEDRDILTKEHDEPVKTVINEALQISIAHFTDPMTGTVTAEKQKIIDYALNNLIIPLRQRSLEDSQSLILRDADHYFTGWRQEWQRTSLAFKPLDRRGTKREHERRVEDRKSDPEPGSFLALFSGLAAWTYDAMKISDFKKQAESGGMSTSMDTSKLPVSAAGGRHWASLGTDHFSRDKSTLSKKEAPQLLIQTPYDIRKAAEEERIKQIKMMILMEQYGPKF